MDEVALDEIARGALADHGGPGCSVAIVTRRGTRFGAYGLARTEPATVFRPDTLLPIASMGKPFTATAVMTLVEAGRVHLDAPVRTYLRDFRVVDETAGETVTVRNLLTHAVGWAGDVPWVEDRGDAALALQMANIATARQILPPGWLFSYSNTAMTVAARLVEVLYGEPFETVVERLILRPLGLDATGYFPERVISAPAASGHRDGKPVQEAWLGPRSAGGAGAQYSNAVDLARWMGWWLGYGPVGPIGEETRTRMITELIPVGLGPASTGLGWHVDHRGGGDVVYHEGALPGIGAINLFVPQAEVGLVVLVNTENAGRIYRRIVDRLLDDLAGVRKPAKRLHADLAPDTLAELSGSYAIEQPATVYERIVVESEVGRLVIRSEPGGFHPPALPIAREHDDLFAVDAGPWRDMPVEFVRSPGGEVFGVRIAGRVFPRLVD
ncbi:serine hydrolase domain-containing protein [Nonomuraea mangrovi]|uniref:Serine hydrolase domain-containing protein n=1 Tax=Nonomuraea mangrovi TaxID=2316207 RepID=A0ABW4T4I0_9ACTN